MRSYRKWVLSLGLAAMTPGITFAGPFSSGSGSAQQAVANNQQSADNVAQALRAAKLAGFDIDVEVRDGTCILEGKIGSEEQKQRATKAASAVPGVRRVENRLAVSADARQEIQQTPDSAAPASNAGVERAGFFSRPKAAPAAAAAAAPAPTTRPQNQLVAERIAAAIQQSGIRGKDFDVKFQNGVAILEGAVSSPQHVAQLTQIVSRVNGVQQVDNRLRAPGMRPASAARTPNQAVAEQIAGALAQAGMSSNDIEVRFNNGTATLRGLVGSPAQAGAAEEIVSQVPGVEAISNQLQVANAARGGAPIQQVNYQPGPMGPGGPMGPVGPMGPGGMQPGMGGPGMMGPGGPGGMGPGGMMGPAPMHGGRGPSHMTYDQPQLPPYAWPAYSNYPNYASLSYPTEYSASAFPYIGPFYPYPQVPLGWRQVQLEWDDGAWNLNFRPRTERWFWFLDSKNW